MEAVARPPTWRVWLLAIRPATLSAGVAPVLVGVAIAASKGAFALGPALAALAAAVLVQIGVNLANDAADFVKGADNADRVGPARAAQKGWLGPREIAAGAAVVLGLALLVGLYLATIGGWPVLVIAAASLVCAVAYTSGPLPLAYVGLGDLFVLLFFGLVATTGTVYVQTLTWPPEGLVAGAAVGLVATAILVVNNLRDRHTDAAAGKRTLAVRLGATFSRWEYTALIAGAYALPIGWVAAGGGLGWLLPLVSAPRAALLVRDLWRTDGAALNPYLGATAKLGLVHAGLLALGLVLRP